MKITIYHNPSCSNSRGALALLRERGIQPEVVEYLKTPLSKAELKALAARMGGSVKDMVRWKQGAEVTAAGINENSSDDALLEAIAQRPVLLNRPIVVTDKGAKLCRPPETLAALL